MPAEFIYTTYKLSRHYPPDRTVLEDISISFYPGAKIGVIGPNGAGKSSLLRIMAGLDDGFNGEARLTPGFTVGYLSQEPQLDPTKNVKENAPKDAKIVSFEDSALMEAAVKTGKADAGVNDNGLLAYYVSQNDDVEIATEFQTGEKYGFSVKKGGNDKLLAAINKGIASPEYDSVYKKWFGESPS